MAHGVYYYLDLVNVTSNYLELTFTCNVHSYFIIRKMMFLIYRQYYILNKITIINVV